MSIKRKLLKILISLWPKSALMRRIEYLESFALSQIKINAEVVRMAKVQEILAANYKAANSRIENNVVPLRVVRDE